ncbi:MAG: hypothetical protein GTN89_09220 [Acidobacteria bacterium]|nr:hypothetical protein [Acidobacteriota bacterium]NIM60534.1 hypothetical protein [Acidobacteriota bacterium]NIO59505.1 hypothetical protein [Acidobacteriota bacterium]NIQ30534.1 hypothetical protein [Acidobacteriota bacterium]NIQ85482.1 hypothetical protein [Acidobacteriota bacterium]
MLLDSGNFSDNPSPQGEIRTRALLEGMQRIGYSVVNVGERDIRLGWEKFATRTRDSGLTFISSNIVDKQTQKPVLPTHQVVDVTSPDGLLKKRVGVVGVVRFNPIFSKPGPTGAPLAIAHPAEPVRQAVAEVRAAGVDLVVLLAAMHRADAARLANDIPGIDFILGSYGGLYTQQPEELDDTVLIYAGNQGKRLGVARVFMADDGRITDYQNRLHLMGNRYPDAPEMLQFVEEALARANAAGRDLKTEMSLQESVALAAGRYTGNQVCASCHAEAYTHWAGTAHAHALETLEKDPQGGGAECRSCHVTALGERGGFTGKQTSPQFASVGCETCHGPGTSHATTPARGYGRVTVASCAGCHTREHSPEFDYYTYLGKVKHQEPIQGSR